MRLCWAPFLLLPFVGAELVWAQQGVFRIGNGIIAPKLLSKAEPKYTPEARQSHVQGAVLLGLVVDEQGEPKDIEIISPLGFGLDEESIRTVRQWRFVAGSKDGKPVKVFAQVQVNFVFPGTWSDTKGEERRTAFNLAVNNLGRGTDKGKSAALTSLDKLVKEKYPRAMALVGHFYLTGTNKQKDFNKGIELLETAANKGDDYALTELGGIYLKGEGVAQDKTRGLNMLKEASVLGSTQAQYLLGHRFELGDDVEKDLPRAMRHFRLCGAKGVAACQYRLGRLMIEDPLERNRIQGIAWMELASVEIAEADKEMRRLKKGLTEEQVKWVAQLKPQLLRRD